MYNEMEGVSAVSLGFPRDAEGTKYAREKKSKNKTLNLFWWLMNTSGWGKARSYVKDSHYFMEVGAGVVLMSVSQYSSTTITKMLIQCIIAGIYHDKR